ncbi:hypothetical protein VP01_664g2 [Puccinia sorghi]|uniref:Uncharacterized protein n=1 Tax=Puccinia sorghi TaxID=27349 RepID=A0A0L6UH42_9BASI|nr:hypothetical protein VP01_664g2 [Puccinia sorghi]
MIFPDKNPTRFSGPGGELQQALDEIEALLKFCIRSFGPQIWVGLTICGLQADTIQVKKIKENTIGNSQSQVRMLPKNELGQGIMGIRIHFSKPCGYKLITYIMCRDVIDQRTVGFPLLPKLLHSIITTTHSSKWESITVTTVMCSSSVKAYALLSQLTSRHPLSLPLFSLYAPQTCDFFSCPALPFLFCFSSPCPLIAVLPFHPAPFNKPTALFYHKEKAHTSCQGGKAKVIHQMNRVIMETCHFTLSASVSLDISIGLGFSTLTLPRELQCQLTSAHPSPNILALYFLITIEMVHSYYPIEPCNLLIARKSSVEPAMNFSPMLTFFFSFCHSLHVTSADPTRLNRTFVFFYTIEILAKSQPAYQIGKVQSPLFGFGNTLPSETATHHLNEPSLKNFLDKTILQLKSSGPTYLWLNKPLSFIYFVVSMDFFVQFPKNRDHIPNGDGTMRFCSITGSTLVREPYDEETKKKTVKITLFETNYFPQGLHTVFAYHSSANSVEYTFSQSLLKVRACRWPQFMWSKAGSLEVLQYIQVLKEEHDKLSELNGFVAWTTFVQKHMGDVQLYSPFFALFDTDLHSLFLRIKSVTCVSIFICSFHSHLHILIFHCDSLPGLELPLSHACQQSGCLRLWLSKYCADVASQLDDLPDNPLANDITGKTPAPSDSNPSLPGDSNLSFTCCGILKC